MNRKGIPLEETKLGMVLIEALLLGNVAVGFVETNFEEPDIFQSQSAADPTKGTDQRDSRRKTGAWRGN